MVLFKSLHFNFESISLPGKKNQMICRDFPIGLGGKLKKKKIYGNIIKNLKSFYESTKGEEFIWLQQLSVIHIF